MRQPIIHPIDFGGQDEKLNEGRNSIIIINKYNSCPILLLDWVSLFVILIYI